MQKLAMVQTELMNRPVAALERHFTAKELGKLWGLNEATIRKMFVDEPGVLRLGVGHRSGKRGYVSIRIPESVARRVHEDRTR